MLAFVAAMLFAAAPAESAGAARLAQAPSPPRRVVNYTCPGGDQLVAEFVTTDPLAPALVRPPGGPPLTLPAQASGSGFRYVDERQELQGRGRDVTWTQQGKRPAPDPRGG